LSQIGDVVAKDLAGPIVDISGSGIFPAKVLAHTHVLRTLAGKYEKHILVLKHGSDTFDQW